MSPKWNNFVINPLTLTLSLSQRLKARIGQIVGHARTFSYRLQFLTLLDLGDISISGRKSPLFSFSSVGNSDCDWSGASEWFWGREGKQN